MAFGVTDQGFVKKDFETIKAELEAQAITQFGSEVDLSIFSPIGASIHSRALEQADQWDLAEEIYYANQIDNATGAALDRVVAFKGLTRQEEETSNVTLTLTGTNGTIVNAGFIAQTPSGFQFITTETQTITGGTVDINAVSIETGIEQNVTAASITEIVTVISGVDTVNNVTEATGGRDVETDAELRARYKASSVNGSSVNGIQGALNELDSVTTAVVFENSTDVTDGDGRPPHSYEAVIEGGTEPDIFDVLLRYNPAGIASYGSETAAGTDNVGVARSFDYNNPTNIDIFVTINITTNANWVAGSEDTVERNTVEVIGGTYSPTSETFAGQGIGIDIQAWRVIAAQIDIAGIDVITVKVGETSLPGTLDVVDIEPRERGRTDIAKIDITVT